MIRFTQQATRCVCETHKETHEMHAKHLIAHRGNFRCTHWDWVTDDGYRTAVERRRQRVEQKRRSSRPRVIAPLIG